MKDCMTLDYIIFVVQSYQALCLNTSESSVKNLLPNCGFLLFSFSDPSSESIPAVPTLSFAAIEDNNLENNEVGKREKDLTKRLINKL